MLRRSCASGVSTCARHLECNSRCGQRLLPNHTHPTLLFLDRGAARRLDAFRALGDFLFELLENQPVRAANIQNPAFRERLPSAASELRLSSLFHHCGNQNLRIVQRLLLSSQLETLAVAQIAQRRSNVREYRTNSMHAMYSPRKHSNGLCVEFIHRENWMIGLRKTHGLRREAFVR